MGRKKVRDMTYIHSFAMDRAIFEELQKRAQVAGVSMSSYLEQLLREAFSAKTASADAPPQQPSLAAEPIDALLDPLVEYELNEYVKRVESFEADVINLERFKNTPPNIPKWADEVTKKNIPIKHKFDVLHRKEDLEEKWFELKAGYDRLKAELPRQKALEISSKLVELKKRIEAI